MNVERRFRGRMDPPLSEAGQAQASLLAAAFDESPPDVVVSSPRRRALQTAAAIVERHRVAVAIDHRLDDVDYGAWAGLTLDEVGKRWPDDRGTYLVDPAAVLFPGGEAILSASARVWPLITELHAGAEVGRIALITHDAIIRLVAARVLGAALAAIHRVRIDLASTTGVDFSGDEPRLAWVNASPARGYAWGSPASD